MRHVLLAASMILAGAALAPASAQYYGPPGYGPSYGPGPGPGYGGPGYGEPYYGPPRRQRRSSAICVTSRGPCPLDEVVPRGWPCGCVVPGFGYKRGNAG